MENASKALIMAGGILIAVLIISLLVYSFGSMNGYFKEEQQVEKTEQLMAFNKQFEAYNRKLLRGTDVVSVINKVLDNNKKYGKDGYDEPNYLMEVDFKMVEEMSYSKNSQKKFFNTTDKYSQDSFLNIKNDQEAFTDFKRRVFDCKGIRYNETTGRVDYMYFEERKLSQEEYEGGL